MTKEEYLKFFKECTDRMFAITKAKNEDYTAGSVNPYANFERVEALDIATTEQGFLTRMTDKLCRINSFCQRGVLSVKDESVEDTLMDLANYSILMMGYIRSKREKAFKPKEVNCIDERTGKITTIKLNPNDIDYHVTNASGAVVLTVRGEDAARYQADLAGGSYHPAIEWER